MILMGACIFSNLVDIHEVLDIFFWIVFNEHSIFFNIILQMFRAHSERVGLKGNVLCAGEVRKNMTQKNVQIICESRLYL